MSLERHQMFCEHCGCNLNCVMEAAGFHIETGNPLFYVRGRCPNKRHWWDKHSSGYVVVYGSAIRMPEYEANSYYYYVSPASAASG